MPLSLQQAIYSDAAAQQRAATLELACGQDPTFRTFARYARKQPYFKPHVDQLLVRQ